KRVGLVTCDTYRIAAVDQLRTYANIIGVPLRVPMSPEEMTAACEALAGPAGGAFGTEAAGRGCDVILIDTAGRSPNDAGRIDELRRFIDAARPHEIHLVLSGTASESCLLRAARQFAAVRPDRVILTKLDEAVNFGIVVSVAR